jgi:hypothetical protein
MKLFKVNFGFNKDSFSKSYSIITLQSAGFIPSDFAETRSLPELFPVRTISWHRPLKVFTLDC